MARVGTLSRLNLLVGLLAWAVRAQETSSDDYMYYVRIGAIAGGALLVLGLLYCAVSLWMAGRQDEDDEEEEAAEDQKAFESLKSQLERHIHGQAHKNTQASALSHYSHNATAQKILDNNMDVSYAAGESQGIEMAEIDRRQAKGKHRHPASSNQLVSAKVRTGRYSLRQPMNDLDELE